jgi:outer membrane protein OmpA-like peptidoglycan-associated protein
LGSVRFESDDGRIRSELLAPAAAAYIDGYPDPAPTPDRARLERDFGIALTTLVETQKLMRSYLMLLESPDGEPSQVTFQGRAGETQLGTPGECLTLDGLNYDPDQAVVTRDFADSREATQRILAEGLPRLPHSYTALLESPQGPVGELEILDGEARGARLDQAGQAVIIDGYSEKVYPVDEARLQEDFGHTLAAQPLPPTTQALYFEPGSASLTRQARAVLPVILAEIRKRPAADVTIAGHADTVSGPSENQRLSKRRAETVATRLRRLGAPIHDLTLDAFGETLLAVTTPDNRPEALNRRVEITVR